MNGKTHGKTCHFPLDSGKESLSLDRQKSGIYFILAGKTPAGSHTLRESVGKTARCRFAVSHPRARLSGVAL